eukprot:6304717-Ditylum_brightwellii.AAC.1
MHEYKYTLWVVERQGVAKWEARFDDYKDTLLKNNISNKEWSLIMLIDSKSGPKIEPEIDQEKLTEESNLMDDLETKKGPMESVVHKVSNNSIMKNKEQAAGSAIIELSPQLFFYTAQEVKKQEREMRTETDKLFKPIQQCESFSIANLKRSILTNLEAIVMQNVMAEEERTVRKAIVMLSIKCNLAIAVQKQEMSVTEKCSDTEKHTA